MIVAGSVLWAALYALGMHRAPRWPWWRAAAFAAGLVALTGALLVEPVTLRDHMVQHLVMTMGAAPLLVLGAPLALALRALRGPARRRLGRVLTSRPARLLVHPATAWALFAAATAGTHFSGVYDLALREPLVHELEHLAYLVTGLLLWTSLAGVHPGAAGLGAIGRLAWLMAAMPVMAGVGAWLATSQVVRYPTYAAQLGAGALADQRDAGSLMWGLGTLPMALIAFGLAAEALWREERRQRRRERAHA